MKGPFGEELIFLDSLKDANFRDEESYYFIDRYFAEKKEFKTLKNKTFLKSGEKLKTLKSFEKLVIQLIKKEVHKGKNLYAIGGGSLGDSVAFLASVYQRGLPLVQVPTTWLSAVDSSLGGKTALNFESYKNQIGSFYPAQKIYYIKDLLKSSDLEQAKGEILKTLFLNYKKKWAKDFLSRKEAWKIKFEDLKPFVKYKTQIVKQDPLDQNNIRAALNLGHTLAHVLELKFSLSHSQAVLYGLRFCLEWSLQQNYINASNYQSLVQHLAPLPKKYFKISSKEFLTLLTQDKKRKNKEELCFVFLSNSGARVEQVSFKELIAEWERQKSGF